MRNLPSLSISEYGLISPSGFFGGTFLNWTAVQKIKEHCGQKEPVETRISQAVKQHTLHSSQIFTSINIHGHNAYIDYHSTALWGKHIALIYNLILKGEQQGSEFASELSGLIYVGRGYGGLLECKGRVYSEWTLS